MISAEQTTRDVTTHGYLGDTAAETIRKMIFTGAVAPGSRIREDELVRTLHVSRTPIRAALLALSKEGLVDLVARKGAFVRSYTIKDLYEVYQIRDALDALAAEIAATRAGPEELLHIEQSIAEEERCYADIRSRARVEDLGPEESYSLAMHDLAFHRAVLEAGGNGQLKFIMDECHVMHKSLFVMLKYPQVKRAGIRIEEHREFLQSLQARDVARARELARAHVGAMILALRADPGDSLS